MITSFNEWSAPLAETSPLSAISNSCLGIEATEYLSRISEFQATPPRGTQYVQPEPLLAALGGDPFGLGPVVAAHIDALRRHNIKPLFVFAGLALGKETKEEAEKKRVRMQAVDSAWTLYNGPSAAAAVGTFRNSGVIGPEYLARYLMGVLRVLGVEWMVAPYTASAQLYYFQKNGVIDTTFASSEIFLYDIPENITKLDFEHEAVVWVRRRNCMQSLGNISSDAFVDSCLLAGCDLTPSLPQLDLPAHKQQSRIKSAAQMVMDLGRGTGNGVCLHFRDDTSNHMQDYTDAFRRARLTVKHSIVLNLQGKAEPLDVDKAPGMMHEFSGRRFPDELYLYFSRGIIGPRILNARATDEFLIPAPLDGGDAVEYRKLVSDQLTEIQTLAVGLLGSHLHNYYQRTKFHKKMWYEPKREVTIDPRNDYDTDKIKAAISSWNVPMSVWAEEFNKHPNSTILAMCVKSLKNKEFAAKTKIYKDKNQVLTHKDELLANTIWRMLQIRNYIDKDHNLTAAGEMLYTIICNIPFQAQEMALVAAELIQYSKLNSDLTTPQPYLGVPDNAVAAVQKHMVLVSRVACFGILEHGPIGYTGVLSRSVLAYASMIEAVRQSCRDLLEVCLVNMLLTGDAERDRNDWSELGLNLPLNDPASCTLGVTVAYHLTELCKRPDTRSQQARADLIKAEKDITFTYATDLARSYQTAWQIWDAVNMGIQESDAKVNAATKAAFKQADEWLEGIR